MGSYLNPGSKGFYESINSPIYVDKTALIEKTNAALNMFTEYSMTDPDGLAEYFGFTEAEVQSLCQEYQMSFEKAQAWYDDYRKLLEALWAMDNHVVAQGIEHAHKEISILQYNNENALSCTIEKVQKVSL